MGLIDYDNIKDTTCLYHNQWTSDSSGTFIVCAPCFYLDMRVYSVALRNATGSTTVYYLNGTGDGSSSSHWTQCWYAYKYQKGAGNNHYYFSHDHSQTNSPSPSVTPPTDIHFWKVVYSLDDSGGQASARLDLYIYGTGNYSQAQYNSICKINGVGRKIYGIKPDYWGMGGTYSTPQACIAAQKCSVYKGSKILAGGSVKVCAHQEMSVITG